MTRGGFVQTDSGPHGEAEWGASRSEGLGLGLEIGVRLSSDTTEMWVRGEIDMLTLPQLSAELSGRLRDGARVLVLDLRDVGFLSAGGVSVLLAAAEQARDCGMTLRVLPSPAVLQVARLLGLTGALNLVGA